jgi:hypothetical protein
VAGSIIALREEDVIIDAALQWLVERNRLAHELLLDTAEPVKTGLKLKVMITIAFGDGRNNGNVVSLGADIVGRRYDCDINI